MSELIQYCKDIYQQFMTLFELTQDQSNLYREITQSIQEKSWRQLNKTLSHMENLACEQSRVNKKILTLRTQIQKYLQDQSIESYACPPILHNKQQLLKISELIPLLPQEQRDRIRYIWLQLRNGLIQRQSEIQVIQNYSQDRQEMIEGFLSALKDEEGNRGQAYDRPGRNAASNEAPAKIFNGEV